MCALAWVLLSALGSECRHWGMSRVEVRGDMVVALVSTTRVAVGVMRAGQRTQVSAEIDKI
jgi:hypothetical protein